MDETIGIGLIERLKNDPEKFYDEGMSYQLLQEYFEGLPKESLKELFCCESMWIRRVAIWITSELGTDGICLLNEVLSQINDNDNYIRSYALEIVANCADGEHFDKFISVFSFLESTNQKTRLSVMNIISDLSGPRIHEAYIHFESKKYKRNSHEEGLFSLLNYKSITYPEIAQMIDSNEAIIRKYGIIIARKLYDKYPQIINEAVDNQDIDIKEFSKQVIEARIAFERFINNENTSAS